MEHPSKQFQLPFPLFNMVKEDCLKDGVFKTEAPEGGGHTPSPIELKMAAYWRYLATGAQVDAHEEGSECARTTLQIVFGERSIPLYMSSTSTRSTWMLREQRRR